jgi:predicted dehydrogenase
MDKIKLALAGCGNMAQVVHLPTLQKMSDVEVVAVVDPDRRKAKAVAERFGIGASFTSLESLLSSPLGEEVQAVDIVTPTDTHRPLAIEAIEAGKHVLIEKPVARTAKEAKDIVDCAKKYGRHVMVGMNSRFRPDVIMLKTFIEKNELGKIYYIKSGWLKQQADIQAWQQQQAKSGGGVILDLGIVMLDMAMWILNYPNVLSVTAETYKQFTKHVEDSAALFARLEGGITFTTEVSWTFQREGDFFYCNVFGDDGAAFINPLKVMKRVHGNLVNLTPAAPQSPVSLYKKSYENEFRHFINTIKGVVPPMSTVEEAAKRMLLVEAIYQSASKHKEVSLKK